MEIFWQKVQRAGFDECWPWLGSTDKDGYGLFTVDLDDGRGPVLRRVPRLAFYFTPGCWPTPQGLHGCDNPSCCNAENLATRLTASQVAQIRDLYAAGGVTQSQLAEMFGTVQSHVCALVNYRRRVYG